MTRILRETSTGASSYATLYYAKTASQCTLTIDQFTGEQTNMHQTRPVSSLFQGTHSEYVNNIVTLGIIADIYFISFLLLLVQRLTSLLALIQDLVQARKHSLLLSFYTELSLVHP